MSVTSEKNKVAKRNGENHFSTKSRKATPRIKQHNYRNYSDHEEKSYPLNVSNYNQTTYVLLQLTTTMLKKRIDPTNVAVIFMKHSSSHTSQTCHTHT